MPLSDDEVKPYIEVLDRLRENAAYCAQAYFEAAKASELWGKVIVFVPAAFSSVAGTLVALDYSKQWGVVAATAGLMAATGSFLGAERKAPSLKGSARKYTQVRHKITTARSFAREHSSTIELRSFVEQLEKDYLDIVEQDEPVSNRYYRRASMRIGSGTLRDFQPNRKAP